MRTVSWREIAILGVGAVLSVAGAALDQERITSAGLSIVGAWITLVIVKRRHALTPPNPPEPPQDPPPRANPPGPT